MSRFAPYIPIDRQFAMAGGLQLPDRSHGAALFADISGFTQLTSRFVEALGRQRGAEEILPLLNQVYEHLVHAVHLQRGSVINFSGDAITCWFNDDDGSRALTAAFDMQAGMAPYQDFSTAAGFTTSISVKIAAACGSARRFVVGDLDVSLSDVIAGRLVDEIANGERLARRGEVLATAAVVERLGDRVTAADWRTGPDGQPYAVVVDFSPKAGPDPWPPLPQLRDDEARRWVLPAVAERLEKGEGHYLAELRPAVALFLAFTGLDFDSDEASGTELDGFIRWVQAVLAGYEGVLLQLTIGDKGAYIYCGFGALVAHSDDALRAVACASVLLHPPDALGSIRDIKIGIAQGQMRTGSYGSAARRAYGVLGAQVNYAARLMSFAAPGEIFCDVSVHASVEARWETETVSLAPGKAQTTVPLGPVYRLGPQRHAGSAINRPERPIIGRRDERSALLKVLSELLDGRPAFAWLSGEAGIGKSRLVKELEEEARRSGCRVLAASGSSIERRAAYWAWRAPLAALLGLNSPEAPASGSDIADTLSAGLTVEGVRRLPLLNDILLMGIPDTSLTVNLPASLRPDNLALLIAELLLLHARDEPLLLVYEDAHWMDAASWNLSLQVAGILKEGPTQLGFVWVARPAEELDDEASRGEALAAVASVREIRLGRLSEGEIRKMVAVSLGAEDGRLPAALLDLVSAKAEGNPFYTQELLLTLREQRLIFYPGETAGAPWQLADDFYLAAGALPDTLQGLILARIDRLSLDQQALLKIAAVIGRTFTTETLSFTAAGFAVSVLEGMSSHLESLEREALLVPDSVGGYSFNHVLTRDTAYQTLLFSQRRSLHRLVAAWYEAKHTNDALAPHYPTLAHHYLYAEIPEKEYVYVCLAAAQAQARFANREALEYLERGLALAPDDRSRFDLHLHREEIFDVLGDRERQRDELSALAGLSATFSDDALAAMTALRQAEYHRLAGAYLEADREADRAIALSVPGAQARGYRMKAQIRLQQGAHGEAQAFLDRALTEFEIRGEQAQVAEVYGDFGILEVYRGDYRAAITPFKSAIARYRDLDRKREAARVLANLAGAYGYLGEIRASIENYQSALDLSREIGDRRLEHIAQGNLGIAYGEWGDFGRAIDALNAALQTSREINDVRKEGSWLGNLGEVFLALGRAEEAAALFHEAIRIATGIGNRNGQGMWLNRLSEAAQAAGEPQAAGDWAEMGLKINQEIGNQYEVAVAHSQLGRLALEEARWDALVDEMEQACAIWNELGLESRSRTCGPWIAYGRWKQGQTTEARRLMQAYLPGEEINLPDARSDADLLGIVLGGEVLEGLGDPSATALFHAAKRLMQQHGERIGNPDLRAEFLSAWAENRLAAHTRDE